MSGLLTSPPSVAPQLQFSCSHCGTELSVPAALAGVKGPCPTCRQVIVAPVVPDRSVRPAAAAPTPLAPRPRLPRPAPPPPEPPATEPSRPSLRRPQAVSATPKPASETSDEKSPDLRRRRPDRRRHESDDDALDPDEGAAPQPWTWAAVGMVVGAGLVFAALSLSHLRRNTAPAPTAPAATALTTEAGRDDDAVAALAAHKQESTRDLKSLLAAQQVVWRFFGASDAKEANTLILASTDPTPLPADGLHSPLTSLTLRSKHRLPNDSGLASHWKVATSRFGELNVEVNDATGHPRINWAKLAPQLGLTSTAEVRTAAAP